MATWVDDIVQALKNLGGQAHRKQIIEEVKRIRTEPLPIRLEEVVQRTIQNYSSDSAGFKGKDLFKKIGDGVWALREQSEQTTFNSQPPSLSKITITNEGKSSWVEDIIQAFLNLGGEATLSQIYNEVSKIRKIPLQNKWLHIVQSTIYRHSSDSRIFQGNDLFRKVGKGVWALQEQVEPLKEVTSVNKSSISISRSYLPTESFEEIANILKTIKQYRDYQHPNSSSWKEYVNEVFHILGFSTDTKNSRLMTLNVMGSNHSPKAIVAIVYPDEDFDELVSGLSWESYLFLAANYYHINWGILTDGMRLKIISFQDAVNQQSNYWPNFDDVVLGEKLDTFCTIYKLFSFMKQDGGNSRKAPNKY